MNQAISKALRQEQHFVVIYLDLDGFKKINDTHGHKVGDQLLKAITLRMKSVVREYDTIARVGGDEFVIILNDVKTLSMAVPLLERLLTYVGTPVSIDEIVLNVSASIGVTCYPQEREVSADHLLHQADQAMYRAKYLGKNQYCVYDQDQDRERPDPGNRRGKGIVI
ncbi:hypothetical protein B566_EDAN018580 [Ephemera danica]|nr:hypothetical protein B566_EDAN018580 [Ephemera danica]